LNRGIMAASAFTPSFARSPGRGSNGTSHSFLATAGSSEKIDKNAASGVEWVLKMLENSE